MRRWTRAATTDRIVLPAGRSVARKGDGGIAMKAEEVRKAGVVGCGLMGSGIVEVCARAGLRVTFVEADAERVEGGHTLIARSLARAEQRGKLDTETRDRVLASIGSSTDLGALADADLV